MSTAPALHIPPIALYDARGVAERGLGARVIRLRHNRYVEVAAWRELAFDEQDAVRALALTLEKPDAVLSHRSAAALLGIPRICMPRAHPEVTVPLRGRNAGQHVRRHRSTASPHTMTPQDAAWGRITVTTPGQTAVDLARVYGLPTGLAAMDHVLRTNQAELAELRECLGAIPTGARGRAKASTCLAIADPRAESPGESLSRARLFELGFAKPNLQHEVCEADGSVFARTDFLLAEGLVGEFDGKVKYQPPRAPDQPLRDPSEVVWAEKQREDKIRRRGYDVARWVWDEALQPDALRAILAEHGLHPSGKPWF